MKMRRIISIVTFLMACAVVSTGIPLEVSFSGTNYLTKELYRGGSGEFFHAEYFPAGQTSADAAKSLDFLRQPLTTDRLDQVIDLHLKTLADWKPKGSLIVLDKSESMLVLKDVRFDGAISGRPSYILSIHELRGHTLLTSQLIFRPRKPYATAKDFEAEFTKNESEWLKALRAVAKEVQEAIELEANKTSEDIRRPADGPPTSSR